MTQAAHRPPVYCPSIGDESMSAKAPLMGAVAKQTATATATAVALQEVASFLKKFIPGMRTLAIKLRRLALLVKAHSINRETSEGMPPPVETVSPVAGCLDCRG